MPTNDKEWVDYYYYNIVNNKGLTSLQAKSFIDLIIKCYQQGKDARVQATVTINLEDGSSVNDLEYQGSDMEQLFDSIKYDYPKWASILIIVVNC